MYRRNLFGVILWVHNYEMGFQYESEFKGALEFTRIYQVGNTLPVMINPKIHIFHQTSPWSSICLTFLLCPLEKGERKWSFVLLSHATAFHSPLEKSDLRL